jgi:hypothetical protein
MLTNTSKLTHENEQKTNEILYFGVEGFHTLHALSLYAFYIYDLKMLGFAIRDVYLVEILVIIWVIYDFQKLLNLSLDF